jgi:carboxyl-terminal processing protease
MKVKRTVLAPVLVAGVAVISGGWLLQRGVVEQGSGFRDAGIFDEVVQYVSTRYVDEHPRDELYQMAVEGMLRELGDPHTTFMSAEDYNELRITTTGDYGGLGIEIGERDGWITVVSVLPGTPAESAGLHAGDRIVLVEGKTTEGWTSDDAVKVLRGPKGKAVEIGVARIGVDEPIPFTVVRDEIHVMSVPFAYMLDDQVGYIHLRVFSETAAREIEQAIQKERAQGMNRLVLDLRGNPGGLLDQGAAVSDLFLDRNDAIVETRSRVRSENMTYHAERPEQYSGLTLVVLVDEYSASAAEIVAGALQDNDRALVIGAPSFGKGSVQTLLPLSGGNFLKMTTGRWYTPSGRSIQKDRKRAGDPVALLEDQTVSQDGQPVTTIPADTMQREEFRTATGRVVYGGGGIVPDIIVAPDTLNDEQKEFFRRASKGGSTYSNVLFRYSLEYANQQQGLKPSFEVTPQMREELLRRLEAAGVEVSPADEAIARRFLNRDIGYQVALNKFSRSVAEQRAAGNDKVVQRALDLLRGADSQQALFEKARMEVAAVSQ